MKLWAFSLSPDRWLEPEVDLSRSDGAGVRVTWLPIIKTFMKKKKKLKSLKVAKSKDIGGDVGGDEGVDEGGNEGDEGGNEVTEGH